MQMLIGSNNCLSIQSIQNYFPSGKLVRINFHLLFHYANSSHYAFSVNKSILLLKFLEYYVVGVDSASKLLQVLLQCQATWFHTNFQKLQKQSSTATIFIKQVRPAFLNLRNRCGPSNPISQLVDPPDFRWSFSSIRAFSYGDTSRTIATSSMITS